MSESITTVAATETAAPPAAGTEAVVAPAVVVADSLLGAADAGKTAAEPVAEAAKEGEAAKTEGDKTGETAAPDYSKIKLPDGVTSDDPIVSAFTAVAGEHNISPEVAQSLIDKVLPGLHTQLDALRNEPMRLANERLSEWATAVNADTEIGGAKLEGVKTNVARAMSAYGNPDEIKAALNETGAGSNPVLIRWLNRMAQATSEGTAVTGGNPAMPKKSPADLLFNHPTSTRGQAAA